VKNTATDMTADASPYYPPRQRWYTKLWYPWYALRRRIQLNVLTDTFDLPVRHKVLLGMVVPALSFRWYGWPLLSWVLMAAYGLFVIGFFVFIGLPAATLSLSVIVSIHAASILQMQKRALTGASLGLRILWSLAVFVMVSQLIYSPLCRLLERRWFMPLQVAGRVLIIRTNAHARDVKRGDQVAYRIGGRIGTASLSWAHVSEGYGLGPVLAVAGDNISFLTNGVSINGELLPRRDYMPTSGSIVVKENHWFIWPRLDINEHGERGDAAVTELMTDLAMVPESAFVGVPYDHWLWRRQTLP